MDYFDLHCDTLYELYKNGQELADNQLAVSLRQAGGFRRWTQVFAIWIPDDTGGVPPYELFRNIYRNGMREFEKNSRTMMLCRSGRDLSRAVRCGKAAALLSVEGGSVLEGNLRYLDLLYQSGVIMLTLTWNGRNQIASGCEADGGLTPFGRQVIERLNALGMITDLSHLNDQSFYEALELADHVAASHSNSRAVCPHRRNLTDEQFLKIRDKGGLTGLCLYPVFLGGTDPREAAYAHLSHFLDLGGEAALAVGSDFDGAAMAPELDGIFKIPELAEYLLMKGLSDRLVGKIFYQNAFDFFTKVLTKQSR